MPKALALTISTRVLNRGLKEEVFSINSHCSNNERLGSGMKYLYRVTHSPILLSNNLNNDGGSHVFQTLFFQGNLSTAIFRGINPTF